ncbi:121_t:CDS:1, partial [Paraglomus occultum]
MSMLQIMHCIPAQHVDVPEIDGNPTTIIEDTPSIMIPGTTGFPVGFLQYILNVITD